MTSNAQGSSIQGGSQRCEGYISTCRGRNTAFLGGEIAVTANSRLYLASLD